MAKRFGRSWVTASATNLEPSVQSLGITREARQLIFVVNCNLQRLDGPVRGNGKIMQELEAVFRGAGWNVIKVVWGSDWDVLLEKDESGLLVQTHERSRRWSVSKVRWYARFLHSRALLWQVSRTAQAGRELFRREA